MASEGQSSNSAPQFIDPENLLINCPECKHTICRSCVYNVLKDLDLPGDQVKTRCSCSECSKKEAICKCGECQKFYCGSCYVAHRRMCESNSFLPDQDNPEEFTVCSDLAHNESHNTSPNPTPDSQLNEDVSSDVDQKAAWEEWSEQMMEEMRKLELKYKDKNPVRADVKEVLSMWQQMQIQKSEKQEPPADEKTEKQEQPAKHKAEKEEQPTKHKAEKEEQPTKDKAEKQEQPTKDKAEKQEQPPTPTEEQLADFDVVECPTPGTFILKDSGGGVMYEVKLETLDQRIKRDMREGRTAQAITTIEKIREQLLEIKEIQRPSS